jgi:hypothetical protein
MKEKTQVTGQITNLPYGTNEGEDAGDRTDYKSILRDQ